MNLVFTLYSGGVIENTNEDVEKKIIKGCSLNKVKPPSVELFYLALTELPTAVCSGLIIHSTALTL
jgi:hypothetical protein